MSGSADLRPAAAMCFCDSENRAEEWPSTSALSCLSSTYTRCSQRPRSCLRNKFTQHHSLILEPDKPTEGGGWTLGCQAIAPFIQPPPRPKSSPSPEPPTPELILRGVSLLCPACMRPCGKYRLGLLNPTHALRSFDGTGKDGGGGGGGGGGLHVAMGSVMA